MPQSVVMELKRGLCETERKTVFIASSVDQTLSLVTYSGYKVANTFLKSQKYGHFLMLIGNCTENEL